MKPKTARHLFLSSLVLAAASGCAIFEAPQTRVVAAGETVATTRDPATLRRLLEVRDSLQTAAMHADICAAGADTEECRR